MKVRVREANGYQRKQENRETEYEKDANDPVEHKDRQAQDQQCQKQT